MISFLNRRKLLQPLPSRRFQIQDVSHRRVNRMGHVAYKQNYYSVPADYMGMNVRLESTNGKRRCESVNSVDTITHP
ncbi:Mu transposase domain-containing protein [Sphingobacterium multivorum]|uniref:Mu transposase domain-containing protein n=1 Tax=Sphingobacterium multivorum TaxID=28454 RepID=UPI0035E436A0